jgi:hypothetical protein
MAASITVTPSVGDGVTTAFTLSAVPVNPEVFIGGLLRRATTDYAIAGTTLTMVVAPVLSEPVQVLADGTTPVVSGATGVTTLLAIRNTIRQRADMVGSLFVTDAELTNWINSSYRELYDLIVEAYGADYYMGGTPDNWYQFTTTATAASYALPDGSSTYKLTDGTTSAPAFYKLLGLDLKVSSDWITLKTFQFQDRNRYASRTGQSWPTDIRYRLNGSTLWLTPQPPSGQFVRPLYVPRCIPLVSDSDTLDGLNGWEEYIVADVAAKALAKEESDPSELLGRKAALLVRIRDIATERDISTPARVTDAREVETTSEFQ